jgi:E3 ubiquitin-protein ligase HUWE1
LISIFNEQELELLISGLPEIEVDDWKANTEYHNYSASSPQIQWFWRAVRSFDKEERAKLLQFVTGTSKVPLNGFKELEGMNGVSRFNIHRDYGNKDRLPSSHTCFNRKCDSRISLLASTTCRIANRDDQNLISPNTIATKLCGSACTLP